MIEPHMVNLIWKWIQKSCEDSQIAYNFHEFWSKELHREKWSKDKTLICECYNLVNSMERVAMTF
jgi:hypothetical protein